MELVLLGLPTPRPLCPPQEFLQVTRKFQLLYLHKTDRRISMGIEVHNLCHKCLARKRGARTSGRHSGESLQCWRQRLGSSATHRRRGEKSRDSGPAACGRHASRCCARGFSCATALRTQARARVVRRRTPRQHAQCVDADGRALPRRVQRGAGWHGRGACLTPRSAP